MRNKIHIIGGGVVGLCSAWYLQQEGFEVTIVDATDLTEGCSHGNAGMIVPSHFIPLAAPGVISKGIRWMFNSKSPFYIKPRVNMDLTQWLWAFYRSCNARHVERSMPILLAYNQLSKALYQEFNQTEGFNFEFGERGLLMLYKTSKAEKEEKEVAEQANQLGLNTQILSASEVANLENGIDLNVLGGVYFPSDAHLYPNLFIQQLISNLKSKGAQFELGQWVIDFKIDNQKISGIQLSNGKTLTTDKVLIAGGSWSAQILKKLGIKMLLQDGKGYSITLKNPEIRPSIPTILTEAKVAVTPMGNDLRIGGTLEISNLSPTINRNRLQGILESMPKYYPQIKIEPPKLESIWHGFRPCSPDGMPYLERSQKFENLTIASGHAMMGMSLGPATGKLVSEILTDKKPSIDLSLMKVDRF